MLGDKGPCTQPLVPRLSCTTNGQRGPLATPTYRNLRPRKNVFIWSLSRARREWQCTTVHHQAPEREGILASILNETALTAGQGLQTDEHLRDDETFAAFMAFCRDGAPTTGLATASALLHTVQDREPASPTRNPASASHQAHLRRKYVALGPVAAVHATTAGDGHAEGQSVEVASQHPHAQDVPTHEVRTPAAAGTVSTPTERMPPRVAQP